MPNAQSYKFYLQLCNWEQYSLFYNWIECMSIIPPFFFFFFFFFVMKHGSLSDKEFLTKWYCGPDSQSLHHKYYKLLPYKMDHGRQFHWYVYISLEEFSCSLNPFEATQATLWGRISATGPKEWCQNLRSPLGHDQLQYYKCQRQQILSHTIGSLSRDPRPCMGLGLA